MSSALTIVAGLLTALAIVVVIFRVSAWLTRRKTPAQFRQMRGDATSINQDSGMAS